MKHIGQSLMSHDMGNTISPSNTNGAICSKTLLSNLNPLAPIFISGRSNEDDFDFCNLSKMNAAPSVHELATTEFSDTGNFNNAMDGMPTPTLGVGLF